MRIVPSLNILYITLADLSIALGEHMELKPCVGACVHTGHQSLFMDNAVEIWFLFLFVFSNFAPLDNQDNPLSGLVSRCHML